MQLNVMYTCTPERQVSRADHTSIWDKRCSLEHHYALGNMLHHDMVLLDVQTFRNITAKFKNVFYVVYAEECIYPESIRDEETLRNNSGELPDLVINVGHHSEVLHAGREAFKDKKVCVIGDVHLQQYLIANERVHEISEIVRHDKPDHSANYKATSPDMFAYKPAETYVSKTYAGGTINSWVKDYTR